MSISTVPSGSDTCIATFITGLSSMKPNSLFFAGVTSATRDVSVIFVMDNVTSSAADNMLKPAATANNVCIVKSPSQLSRPVSNTHLIIDQSPNNDKLKTQQFIALSLFGDVSNYQVRVGTLKETLCVGNTNVGEVNTKDLELGSQSLAKKLKFGFMDVTSRYVTLS